MDKTSDEAKLHTVTCHVCHQAVPHAEALTAEGQEYLYYFCGRGCYSHWQHGGGPAAAKRRQQSSGR